MWGGLQFTNSSGLTLVMLRSCFSWSLSYHGKYQLGFSKVYPRQLTWDHEPTCSEANGGQLPSQRKWTTFSLNSNLGTCCCLSLNRTQWEHWSHNTQPSAGGHPVSVRTKEQRLLKDILLCKGHSTQHSFPCKWQKAWWMTLWVTNPHYSSLSPGQALEGAS